MRGLSGFLACLAVFALAMDVANAAQSMPHRALYDVALKSAPDGGVSGVSGKISIEWQHSCSGWTFEYRSFINVSQPETGTVRLSTAATTWESRDGRQYRFNVLNRANGRELEKVEGSAGVAADGSGGKAVFTAPARREIDLPPGTLFPVAHGQAILAAAASRKPPIFLAVPVFDGMDTDSLYLVNAVVGRGGGSESAGPSQSAPVDPALKGLRRWPVGLAYFKSEKREPDPSHETTMMLFENGVSDRLIMDFSDFLVRATLSKLEIYPRAECGSG